MFRTYGVDKAYNSILKIPLFQRFSHSSQNRLDTMGEIVKTHQEKPFRIFGGSFYAYPSSDILNKQNIKGTASKRNIWGQFDTTKGEGKGGALKRRKMQCHEKGIHLRLNLNNIVRNG